MPVELEAALTGEAVEESAPAPAPTQPDDANDTKPADTPAPAGTGICPFYYTTGMRNRLSVFWPNI